MILICDFVLQFIHDCMRVFFLTQRIVYVGKKRLEKCNHLYCTTDSSNHDIMEMLFLGFMPLTYTGDCNFRNVAHSHEAER